MSRTAIAAFVCLVAATRVSAQTTLTGRIVGITDGDTLTLLDDGKQRHHIRLEGIDAPESKQAFGKRSKQSLGDLAFDRRTEAFCSKADRYGRRVCKVMVNGIDVGLEQIRRGVAWRFKRYEKEQSPEDRAAYAAAEDEARAAQRTVGSLSSYPPSASFAGHASGDRARPRAPSPRSSKSVPCATLAGFGMNIANRGRGRTYGRNQ